ncbi:hypothetical protein [Mesonia sp. HuA40]|uniref:hypothetical protein n=1 Tax=Mesonia sp. HuA40 TaxID=2602761 RepID=UPI0011CCC7FD|nr:hypothetical protein [Mesonia sp. HuA40]TXK72721.1 hypothetical protein FT993_07795 [Mesonia sp. HuA40]
MKKIIVFPILVLSAFFIACESEQELMPASNTVEAIPAEEFKIFPLSINLPDNFLESTYDLSEHDLDVLISSWVEELYALDFAPESESYYIGFEFTIDDNILTLKPAASVKLASNKDAEPKNAWKKMATFEDKEIMQKEVAKAAHKLTKNSSTKQIFSIRVKRTPNQIMIESKS